MAGRFPRIEAGVLEAELGAGWRERVVSLEERRVALLGELDRLSSSQRDLIAGGESERLLSLLRERQDLVDELVSVSGDLAVFRDRWEDVLDHLPAAERARVEEADASVSRLSALLLARDAADRAEIVSLRDATARRLGGLSAGRRAVSAYGGATQSGPRYQDRKG